MAWNVLELPCLLPDLRALGSIQVALDFGTNVGFFVELALIKGWGLNVYILFYFVLVSSIYIY